MPVSIEHQKRMLSHLEAQAESAGYRVQTLLNALEPFARIAHEYDFSKRADNDVIEVPFKHLKQAWIAFATGGHAPATDKGDLT